MAPLTIAIWYSVPPMNYPFACSKHQQCIERERSLILQYYMMMTNIHPTRHNTTHIVDCVTVTAQSEPIKSVCLHCLASYNLRNMSNADQN